MDGFLPLRDAPRRKRTAAFLIGPLLWLVALLVVGVVVRRLNVIEVGLAVAFASLFLGFVLLVPQRARRQHREQEEAP